MYMLCKCSLPVCLINEKYVYVTKNGFLYLWR